MRRRACGVMLGVVLASLLARDTVASPAPAEVGQFGPLLPLPVVPIHMHLLPNGKLLLWDWHNHANGLNDTPHVVDVDTGLATAVSQPGFDLFCSGHTFLADGRLLIAGGHINDDVGEPRATIFDPSNNSWHNLPNMSAGRWYPSCLAMPDGSVFVEAGTITPALGTNPLPEVWDPSSPTRWRGLDAIAPLHGAVPSWASYYPFLYPLPGGRVFVAGPQQMARIIDTRGSGSVDDVAPSAEVYRDYGSSVMYDTNKVMIVGGNRRDSRSAPTIPPVATAETIDLADPSPHWVPTGDMSIGRRQLNTTLLPDGTVLATGGSSLPGFDNPDGAVLHAELWTPATGTWTPLASHTRYRGYHSEALLLPDGRVVVAGGGHPNAAGQTDNNNMEIFSPPYLFRGPRPAITAAPAIVRYGTSFAVQTPDAEAITRVNLLRLGSVTHSFNQSQQMCQLGAPTSAADGLLLSAPANADICPPGPYMLFALNAAGVPSVAKFVLVAAPIPTPTATLTATATATPTPTRTGTVFVVSGKVTRLADAAPVNGAVVAATRNSATDIASTNSSGAFLLQPYGGDVQLSVSKLGDTGGVVTAIDASYVLQAAVGLQQLSAEQRLICDSSGDGTVSAIDAVHILQYRVGITSRLPVAQRCNSDWLFFAKPALTANQSIVPPLITTDTCAAGAIELNPLGAAVSAQDFQGAVFGDCAPDVSSRVARAASEPRVTMGAARSRTTRVQYPVLIDGGTSTELEATVHYDPTALKVGRVRKGRALAGWLMYSAVVTSGQVRVVAAGAHPPRRGTAFVVVFRPIGATANPFSWPPHIHEGLLDANR